MENDFSFCDEKGLGLRGEPR